MTLSAALQANFLLVAQRQFPNLTLTDKGFRYYYYPEQPPGVWTGTEWSFPDTGDLEDNQTSGAAGLSAFEVAVNQGYVGTESDWLLSLKGADGLPGVNGEDGQPGPEGAPGAEGPPGTNGVNGKSAYELAVEAGFVGTNAQYLASLKGSQGATGPGIAPGGTTGQLLVKKSNATNDTAWITPATAGPVDYFNYTFSGGF